jgi:integrase
VLGTGLRIGEVCGVRICDLDLDGVPVMSGAEADAGRWDTAWSGEPPDG